MTLCDRERQPVIAIKFCGGCNPRVNRGAIAAKLAALLAARGCRVVFNALDDAGAVIYLSGCAANCARRYSESDLPAVAIAGEMIDGLATPATDLANAAVAKVVSLLSRLDR